jgi:hypothetical protein
MGEWLMMPQADLLISPTEGNLLFLRFDSILQERAKKKKEEGGGIVSVRWL